MKTRKPLAILLALVMALSLLVPALAADGTPLISPNPNATTYPTVEAGVYEIQKYGNLTLDILPDVLLDAGYEYGDILTVTINDTAQEMPFGTNYSDVQNGEPVICNYKGALVIAINMGDLATTLGLATKNPDTNEWIFPEGTTIADIKVTIDMAEKAGYLDEYLMNQLERTDNREDYSSDAVFANFRPVVGVPSLYRTSSPVDNGIGRAAYADDLIEKAGVKAVLNLANSDEAIEEFIAKEGFDSPYYASLFKDGKVIALNLGVDFSQDSFKSGLAEGLRFLAANEGPYAVHCSEGKDRAGFVSALLECLMGVSYQDVVADYMLTYENYYHVVKGSDQYEAIAKNNIEKTLVTLAGEDAPRADLAAAAETYLKGIGLTNEEIAALKTNLAKEPGEGEIVILHSNDVHGAVEGYATMAALKQYYETQGAEVLLVDAGDYIQGTTYVSVSQGASAVEMMNLAGYDYAALGNHEFDYGYENLKTILEKADFEVLSANTLLDGAPAFGDHAVVELGGVKVGIFGLETPETASKAHPAKIKGITFLGGEDLYACAQKQVDALKAEGCQYIICLGHLGVDEETAATANRSVDLLGKVTGIDVFIDGHSHSTIADIDGVLGSDTNKVGDTWVTSTGTKFANYGVVTIAADGTITTELIDAAEAAAMVIPSASVAAQAKEIVDEIEAQYGEAFAKTEVLLNGDKEPGNRTEETNLGDLITDAILWYATKDGGLEVDDDHVVALTNGGGIRAPIAAGDITRNDVNTVLPFGNTVTIVYIKGSALLEALEASTFCTPTAVGGFPQVSGIQFTIDTSKAYNQGELYGDTTYYGPKSIQRVTIDSINGKAFDPEATYAVVTNDFTASGGDTYHAFAVATGMDTGTPMDEALIAYIDEVLGGTITAEKYGEPAGRIVVTAGTEAEPEPEAKPIVILHSNDVHGAIEGYATMAALKEYYAAQGAEVLLVDAGDYIQGTTYVSVSQGASAVEMMNLAGYDYAALGNHEFDYGYANLKAIMEKANFKVLSANTLFDGEPAFGDHAVVELGGVKVGIFGLETPETATKAHPAKIKGVTFLSAEELYACAQKEVDALKAEGCQYIICIGHLGVDDETAATANRSIDLLAKVTGIDVFIDGHSHSTIADIDGKLGSDTNKVGSTWVTSTGTKFANFGVVTIAPDGTITTQLLSAEDAAALVEPKESVKAAADAIIAEIEAAYGAPFAKSEVLLNGDKEPGNRTEETNLGNLITDAILWFATKDGGLAVDADHIVALTNGGGIRAPIAAGDITRNDVNTVLPFGNTVAIVYIKGADLLEALEASTFCTPTAVGGFPQVSGIQFTIDTTKEFDQGELYPETTYYAPASIQRVTINSINGKPFDPEATYAVVTNDFTAAGGDTYHAFSVATVMDTGTPMDEALIAYIEEVLGGTVGTMYAKPEGRIVVSDTPAAPPVVDTPPADDVPPTGDVSMVIWVALAAFSGTGMFALKRKKEED